MMIRENMSFYDEQERLSIVRKFMAKVYGNMTVGLLITALTSYAIYSSETAAMVLLGGPMFIVCILGELALVWGISARINSLKNSTARILFWLYSALNGVTITAILMRYTSASAFSVFLICAGAFAGLSLFAIVTKRNIGAMSGFLTVGLIGLLIAVVVNMFFQSGMFNFLVSIVGVVVFAGLTAYDTNRIKESAYELMNSGELAEKGAIIGALTLYLDFINLFLFLLRLLGRRD